MTHRMLDGTVVRTANAVKVWNEDTRFNGSNHISVHTGSQWDHQVLHKTRKGRYWLLYWSNMQGALPHAEFVSPEEATRWLLLNGDEVPEDLEQFRESVEE